MSASIVGLDIGNGVIRAAEITVAGKAKPTLVRYHSMSVAPGSVHRGEVVDHGGVVAALKQLWSSAGFKSKRVVLGVGNQRVLVREVSVPRMPLTQIRESLPFQVQDLLPVPVADALLDFYPVSAGTTDAGEMINGLLIAAVKEPVLKNVQAVQAAGLDPVEVDLIPFALARSLLEGATSSGTLALLHVGAVTTSLLVAVDGAPQFIRILQYGGDDVTSALVKKLGITAEQADQIKRGLGLASEGVAPEWRPAVETIAASTGDLLESVRNTLSFYVNTHPDAAFQRILISGGGAQLPGFGQALAEATRLPVGLPNPLGNLTVGKSIDDSRMQSDPAGLAVAAGLALGNKS